jgi:hypothetical protein
MDKTEPISNPNDTRSPVWLTKQQAAALLRKTLPMITKLQERGYLHAVLRNGKRLFALAEVEAPDSLRSLRPGCPHEGAKTSSKLAP